MSQASNTPGPWKLGIGSSVVSEHPIEGATQKTGHGDTEYYGGYLIAESILRIEDGSLIAAAPDLLEALEELVKLMQDSNYRPDSFTLQPALAAIAKAKGETNASIANPK